MTNKYLFLPIASLALMIFLVGCGSKENPFTSPKPVGIWTGTWASSTVISSGTMSVTIVQSGTTPSGSITMNGSPCFSTGTITGWTVAADAVSLEFPGNWQFYRNHFWSVDIRELLGDFSRCMLRRYRNFLSHKYVTTLPTLLMKADAVLQKVFSGSAVQYNYSRADAVS